MSVDTNTLIALYAHDSREPLGLYSSNQIHMCMSINIVFTSSFILFALINIFLYLPLLLSPLCVLFFYCMGRLNIGTGNPHDKTIFLSEYFLLASDTAAYRNMCELISSWVICSPDGAGCPSTEEIYTRR